MCLIALHHDPDGPVVLRLIANRDEFHARPTAPLAEWSDIKGVVGGRDLQAGGTWLAAHRRGRVAALTNVRDSRLLGHPDSPSRGHLVTTALTCDDPRGWLEQLAAGEALAYAGFNLLVADGRRLWHLHRGSDGLSLERLAPGVHGLSNANLDTPWPKLVRARRALARSLENGGWPAAALAAFADERRAADAELPDTGMGVERERQLSAAFIHGRDYGTRSTTCLEWRADGRLEMHETRYGPEAAPLGSRRLVISAPPAAVAEPESVGVRR